MKKLWKEIKPGDPAGQGVWKTEAGVNFAVAVETEEPVSLLLYRKGTKRVSAELPLGTKTMGNVYSLCLAEFPAGDYEYNYKVGENILTDERAARIAGRKRFGERIPAGEEHQIRGGFDFGEYDWEDDRFPKIPYQDGILYQLHVRGFTREASSGVKAKGTFLGITEKIPYLKELGVNQLLLMPAYDFEEYQEETQSPYLDPLREQKVNYWGYAGGYYFAPKPTYSYSKDANQEFRDMVKALHREGIEVLMEFFFGAEASPCFVAEVCRYWAFRYHVDGFCLVGNGSAAETLAKDPLLARTKILSKNFNADAVYPGKQAPAFKILGELNDGYLVDCRRMLKGDEGQLQGFLYRIRRNAEKFQVINYITHHDGFTLMDLVSYEERHNEANGENNQDGPAYNFSWNCGAEGVSRKKKVVNLRKKQMKNAFVILLFSQGTPMLLAGDEFGNSQRGNNNPYCQDNEISYLEWKNLPKNRELFSFVREALAFRKTHPLLHQKAEPARADYQGKGMPDLSYHGNQAWYVGFEKEERHVGVMYCGEEDGEDAYLYIAYNFHWKEQSFALPTLSEPWNWYQVMDTENGFYEEEVRLENQKQCVVPERTIALLVGRK